MVENNDAEDANLSVWQRYKKNLGDTRPWDMVNPNNFTTDEKAEYRYNICKQCPELTKATKQCKKCLCYMPAKTKLEAAKCPIGKW